MKHFLFAILACVAIHTAEAQITPSTEPVKEETSKYLQPIPEENGKVYMQCEVKLPDGLDKEGAFSKMQAWFDRCLNDKRILRHTDIPASQPQTLQSQLVQEIIFSKGLLALDSSEMTYVLTLSLSGDKMVLKISHISFLYNGDNYNREMTRYSGESQIADGVALNKKRTKLVPGYKKFRTKAMDLMDEYEASLKSAFWIE